MRNVLVAFSLLALSVAAACGGSESDANPNGAADNGPVDDDASSPDAQGPSASDGATDAGNDVNTTKVPGPRPGACSPAVTVTPGKLTEHTKGSVCTNTLGYYDYVPPDYESQSNWPLLLAFHGDGQRGNGTTDLPSVLTDGLPPDIQADKWDPKHRYVVLMPQMDDRGGLPDRTGTSVNDFIAFAKVNYDIDVNRIYLTGFSGGGEPIYNYLGQYKGGEVAANNINAGWYSTQGDECTWKDIPVWYFHANDDGTVPPAAHTNISYANLVGCSPAPKVAPRYTEYIGIGHSAWVPTYDLDGMSGTPPIVTTSPGNTPYSMSIYDWFLQYSR